MLKRWRDRQARLSRQAWQEDKQAAHAFVAQQPDDVQPALQATLDELAALGETSEPPRPRVHELLAHVDQLVAAGVSADVYRLGVVDAAIEYVK